MNASARRNTPGTSGLAGRPGAVAAFRWVARRSRNVQAVAEHFSILAFICFDCYNVQFASVPLSALRFEIGLRQSGKRRGNCESTGHDSPAVIGYM